MQRRRHYDLTIDNCGDPDKGQDPDRRVYGTKLRRVGVVSFEGASKACEEYRDDYGLGRGNWTGGIIKDGKGAVVGYVEYNGTVWSAGPQAADRRRIWPEPAPVEAPRERAPDPYKLEDAYIDTPFGPVHLQGEFDRCVVREKGRDGFVVDGVPSTLSVWLDIDESGLKATSHWQVLKEGLITQDGNVALVRSVVEPILRDWVSEPENMAILVRNTIKTQQRMMKADENRIAAMQAEIASRQDAVTRLQDVLADLSNDGPKPR